jgi:two-component system, cell cycle response regulator DivK
MSKKVLIVEDDKLSRKLAEDLLQQQGYQTLSAKNGEEGVSLAKEHVPDLIIMDIKLPEISGPEALTIIKANKKLKHIPVIAATPFAMKGDEEKFLGQGFDAYIAKPYQFREFLNLIDKILKTEQKKKKVLGPFRFKLTHTQNF